MKKCTSVFLFSLIIILISSLLTACPPLPTELDNYQFKAFSSDWQKTVGKFLYHRTTETPKLYNAILYYKDQEVFRFDSSKSEDYTQENFQVLIDNQNYYGETLTNQLGYYQVTYLYQVTYMIEDRSHDSTLSIKYTLAVEEGSLFQIKLLNPQNVPLESKKLVINKKDFYLPDAVFMIDLAPIVNFSVDDYDQTGLYNQTVLYRISLLVNGDKYFKPLNIERGLYYLTYIVEAHKIDNYWIGCGYQKVLTIEVI